MTTTRKIDPNRKPAALKPDGSPRDNNRVEIGPTDLAFAEWAALGLTAPNLTAMREFRLARLVSHIAARGYGGMLMFDPLNIRYATDSTNMQLWNTHNPFRACLVCPDGHMVLWDYKNSPFLSEFNPLVREVRSGASMFYCVTGDQGAQPSTAFAAEVAALLREHSGTNRRLGVDKIMISGLRALEAAGLTVIEAEELTEKARSIKGPDEILAMRCAMAACEAGVAEMERLAAPGMAEDEIWAILHAENIKRGGEWIECRLMASGPRTNPWFQECGPRIVQPNEILAFDTDLVGCYGMCSDFSRTWFLGDQRPTNAMIHDYRMARDHIDTHMAMLKPGVRMEEIIHGGHILPPEYQKQKYSVKIHGVGLCDEWPFITYPDQYAPGSTDYPLEPGMCLCVEALVSREGGDFSVKLEDQVLVTETGVENLTKYPFDARLMGG
jgi:Xaa-Pro dipeptidase